MAGDSAGGNLAAALTLMARDRIGPMPVFQLLIYPVFDHARDMASPTTTLRCPHRARPSHNRPPHAASPRRQPSLPPATAPAPGRGIDAEGWGL
ncbi:alpha/beta hydrolase [Streptomyces sp. NBC_01280]|uniref:alpha/beta hydrolase fold domain-containing protein n=1 Tax=Streptomyces sp. NBC_01280 TaxID=2903810 RepID=UPI002E3460D2|nr:alpha/beta hydrolase fold domain-containing protein [Streptomyces sp. NBC_01280]